MGVREAELADIPALLMLCQEMHAEGSYKIIALSKKKLALFFDIREIALSTTLVGFNNTNLHCFND